MFEVVRSCVERVDCNLRIGLINLVGRQFCPTVLACGDRHAHNRTPISARTTFAQLIFSKTA